MDISSNTKLVALFGDPVSHSVSPLIHNHGFGKLGLDLVYLVFNVKAPRLADAVKSLKTLDCAGANITIPHKEEVIFFLDELTDRATAVGAVNTIICRRDFDGLSPVLVGDNTDVAGFLSPLERYSDKLFGREALVWGSGGVARAACYALLGELNMSRVHLVCRSKEKGAAIAQSLDELGGSVSVVNWDYAALAMQKSSLLVNATPLGMTPHIDGTPCQEPDLIRKDQIVFDLVYNPVRTALLKQAEEAGARCIVGLDMLIGQAAASFAAWTGDELPVGELRGTLLDVLQP